MRGNQKMKARNWRKVHRYLGLIIGVQLFLWTVSGMVFSWNSIRAVRGENMIRTESPVDLSGYPCLSFGHAILRREH